MTTSESQTASSARDARLYDGQLDARVLPLRRRQRAHVAVRCDLLLGLGALRQEEVGREDMMMRAAAAGSNDDAELTLAL